MSLMMLMKVALFVALVAVVRGQGSHSDQRSEEGQDRSVGSIAFHVYHEPLTFGAGGTDTPVPFSTVELNVGNGYVQGVNAFIAPQSGLYHFNFSLVGNNFRALLYVNEEIRGRIGVVDVFSDDSSSSQGMLMELNQGDSVQVRLQAGMDIMCNPNRLCSFSGYFICP